MPYSIQLYTVRKALEEDLAGTIQRLAGIGFTMVEPYRFVAKAAELQAGHGREQPHRPVRPRSPAER